MERMQSFRKSLSELPSRREFLLSTGAILATWSVEAQTNSTSADDDLFEFSDDEVAAILKEDGEPGFVPRAVIENYWFQRDEAQRDSPTWPSDEDSFDYRHIAGVVPLGTTFEISASVLQELIAACSFSPSTNARIVLFGLRGCSLAEGVESVDFSARHEIRTTRPDHLNLRCLLGVWNRDTEKVALFSGSTVPNVDLMQAFVDGGSGCNMMPTGFHKYVVGPHRGKRQPGAFRQRDPLWVLRTPENLGYSLSDQTEIWDDLDGSLPFDNIHAAMLNGRSKPPFFSSAGCQVVAGRYRDGVPTGAWREFRKAAGLAHPPEKTNNGGGTRDDGQKFDYMLWVGDEAALAASDQTTRTLRFGSRGPRVVDLQKALGFANAEVDGAFGRYTLGRFILWQREQKRALTGVVSERDAEALGVDL
ncbi:MAG: hypothetical protein AAFU69_05480 [Pseudomonadota bacterium]